MSRKNLVFFGIDSLRRDHMSLYGYDRLTTPHIDKWAQDATVFTQCFSPNIPTSSGYSAMLTGTDLFTNSVVALRHQGDYAPGTVTLAEALRKEGYDTTCIGFGGNVASRGFDRYIEFSGWGSLAEGRSPKAENLNAVAIPELKRMAAQDKPFFLFLRHMDPHSPYLPPAPYERMFYDKNEFDPNNHSCDKMYAFKPFIDYFVSWMPKGLKDADYLIAQYDGAIAYMDACIQNILTTIRDLGIEDETLVVFTSDHGETLNDHDCLYDHHGLYDCTLMVPFALKLPGVTKPLRDASVVQLTDVMPTVLSILGIDAGVKFDGRDLTPLMHGKTVEQRPEIYLTECTWMRKNGWRTPEWKYIEAKEPDFHWKPAVELYNLIDDPEEYNNLAESDPTTCAYLKARMDAHIAARKAATGNDNPIDTNLNWCGHGKPFASSEEAYETLHIGDVGAAIKLQAGEDDK